MNELSTDLNVITAEINSFKQIAGQSIWEIGRRLNYVKEHDLAHGEFMKWLDSIGFEHTEAKRFMKVAKELPNSDTWHHLGNGVLYLIATLPEEERKKEHTTSKGETKTVDEMTVRELQELKKQLKEKEKQLKKLNYGLLQWRAFLFCLQHRQITLMRMKSTLLTIVLEARCRPIIDLLSYTKLEHMRLP